MESDDNSSLGPDYDDSNDMDYAPSQSLTHSQVAKKPRKKYKQNRAKVTVDWSDELKSTLIKAIEERRCLWDKNSPEYKMNKAASWQEVADIFGREDINVDECKAQWGNLRVTFNTNLGKYRHKKSGQGASESVDIVWKHFKSMMFLEASNVRQSTESTSSMTLVIFFLVSVGWISHLTFSYIF